MFSRSLAGNTSLSPSRLRKLMCVFFVAMAVPTAVLVYKSYDQLKWEAFYQHRQLAEELSTRLDKKLSKLVQREQQRSFGDYNFAAVDGNATTNYSARSALSAFPISSDMPGVIGYFQIDASGVFTTPLLPNSPLLVTLYGLSAAELNQRRTAQAQVEEILSSNQLVQKRTPPAANTGLDESFSDSPNDVASSVGRLGRRSESYSSGDDSVADLAVAEPGATAPNQAAFDRLSESKQAGRGQTQESFGKDSVLSKLEELELDSPYKQKVDQRNSKLAQKKQAQKRLSKSAPNKSRISSKRALDLEPVESDKNRALQSEELIESRRDASTNIKLFESDIDPFEVSLLESGHFVLYRKVWRSGQRYIQGLLLEQKPFINAAVADSFNASLLANMSTLTVVYQGNVLGSFSNSDGGYVSRAGPQLTGSLLYRVRMSEPFNEFDNVFTIRRLPNGPGGQIIVWAAFIIALVLSLGVFLLYRMSLRNLQLVNQQQDFVSAVSHELKTPLTSIRMYGEILQQGWADEDKKKSYYSYIFDESERLTRLINNVLQLARMTRNETQVSLVDTSVAELLDTVQSKVSSQIERANFSLTLELDDRAASSRLNMDPDVFTQIIINLVDNAIKFSKNADKKVVEIGATLLSNGKVCFSVRDHGPGIAKDQLKKIFELFYRSENELTRQTTGTGIGLALVSQLTQLMNGEIDVVNRNPGAEFKLYFSSKGKGV